jgi:hypothetical protein
MRPIQKIAICETMIQFYESDNPDRFVFGMCKVIKRLCEMQSKEDGRYYKGLLINFPEFCRHEKYGEPVLWWNPFDFQSRIDYLKETIQMVLKSENAKIEKIQKLLRQASEEKNFLKVSQAKKILKDLEESNYGIHEHYN